MMNITISKTKKDQLEEIAEAYAEAFESVGEEWNRDDVIRFVDFMYKHQADMLYVAIDNGKIVGGVWGIIKPWHDGNHLSQIELFVIPDHQGKRISLMLYEKILTDAIDQYDITEMTGMVDGRKEFPLEYYKSLGRKVSYFVEVFGEPNEVLRNVRERLSKEK